MGQISKILTAWAKVFSQETTEEHIYRADICSKCPKAKYVKYLDFLNDELTEVKGYVCSVCSCPLIAKIRSIDKCPENKW